MRRGRGLWKMDSAVITENACTEKLRTLWGQLQRKKGYFPDLTMKWIASVKRIYDSYTNGNKVSAEVTTVRWRTIYTHACIAETGPQRPNATCFKPSETNIVRLHSRRLQKMFDDNNRANRSHEDQPTTSFRRNGDVQSGPFIL